MQFSSRKKRIVMYFFLTPSCCATGKCRPVQNIMFESVLFLCVSVLRLSFVNDDDNDDLMSCRVSAILRFVFLSIMKSLSH